MARLASDIAYFALLFSLVSGDTLPLLKKACDLNPFLDFCSDVIVADAQRKSTSTEAPLPLPADEEEGTPLPQFGSLLRRASAEPEQFKRAAAPESGIGPATKDTVFPVTVDEVREKSGDAPKETIKMGESETVTAVKETADSRVLTLPSPPVVEALDEEENSVQVFVSEHCVLERERFVRGCYGDVKAEERDFCKSYPAACSTVGNVIPIMTYCSRYYKAYPGHCRLKSKRQGAEMFCFAFERFCLPELFTEMAATKAKPAAAKPKSSLRNCQDVLPEARSACNPFPAKSDQFNYLRCTSFMENCKKYVDWQ